MRWEGESNTSNLVADDCLTKLSMSSLTLPRAEDERHSMHLVCDFSEYSTKLR